MVEYGEMILFITDMPIEKHIFGWDSQYLLNNPNRKKIFDDYKESWFAVMRWHGDVDNEEDFYESEAHNGGVMSVIPYYVPKYDREYVSFMETRSKVLVDSFGGNYVYWLDGHLSIYYRVPYEHNDEFNYGGLMNECGKELFAWILEFMRERIDSGSKVNKLVHCYASIEDLNVGFKNIDFDLDTIKVPDRSYEYICDQAKNQGVTFDFHDYGFIINFYKGSKNK